MAQNAKTIDDLLVILEDMRAQIAALTGRVAQLEAGAKVQPPAVADVKPAVPSVPVKRAVTEEEILAISAALGAYLGVRVHIRQVRLLSSSAWAQQGRVSVHAHIPYTH
jgi:methylmalonyl-CoA carboxyltransferase large subunit